MILSRIQRLILEVGVIAGSILLCHFLSGQSDLQLQSIRFTEDDGLYWNNSYDVLLDDDGYAWLLHKDAISRFDGQESIVFSPNAAGKFKLEGQRYNSFFKDQDGIIWACSNTGLYRINPRTFETDTIQLSVDENLYSFSKNSVNNVSQINDTTLFVGREKSGYSLLNTRTLKSENFLPFKDLKEAQRLEHFPNSIGKVLPDPKRENYFWANTAYGFMEINLKEKSYAYFKPDTLDFIVLRDMVIDKDGIIWATTWVHGICSFDTHTQDINIYNCPKGKNYPKSCRNGSSLIQYDENTLLIAGAFGLYTFDKSSHSWNWLNNRQLRSHLPGSPSLLYRDKDENIWISTYGDGLFVVHKHLQHIKNINVPGYNMDVIEYGDGLTYSNYYDQLIFINVTKDDILKFDSPEILDSLDHGLSNLAVDSQNRLWVLDEGGIFVYNPRSKKLEKNPFRNIVRDLMAGGYYIDMYITDDDIMWLSAQNNGAKSVDLNTGELIVYNSESENPMLRDYSIKSLFIDSKSKVWFSAFQGLSYYDPNDKVFKNPEWPITDSSGNIYFDKYVLMDENSNGQLFAGQKLNRIAELIISDKQTRIIPCSICDSLPDLDIFDLTFDANNNLWLTTGHGLFKINEDFQSYGFYGPSYGIKYGRKIMQLSNGDMLCTHDGGYVTFDPDSISSQPIPPEVLITEFKVFDEPFNQDLENKNARLSFRQNFFSFDYHALDYISKDKKQYQYKLEGLNDDWVNAENREYAAYTNLDGGYYTFKVRARRNYEKWNSELASMDIFISTPFYKTKWFIILLSGLLLSIIYFLFKLREKQIQQKSQLINAFNQQLAEVEMKALRAQMNPHFLFNSLNAIKYFVQKNEKDKAENYLSNFASLIRLVLNNSAQKTIPLNDEIAALDLYIRIERMRFDEKFDYNITVDPEINTESIKIPPLILQPYVENAIWHGLMHKTDGTGILNVSVFKDGETIKSIIEDNGIGRERANELKTKSAEKRKSMGMKITRSRMELNAQITKSKFSVDIQDLKDKHGNGIGTRVIISIS